MTVAPFCRLQLCRARASRMRPLGAAPTRRQRICRRDREGTEKVPRCTAPGAGHRAARRPHGKRHGVNRTFRISLRMREKYMSIKGCECKCQFLSLYFTGIAPRELRTFRPRVLIFAARPRRFSDLRRNAGIPALWPRRRAIATDRTDAPSPAPWCLRGRSGARGFC